MALPLHKGGNLSLSTTDPTLTRLSIGLGWQPPTTDGVDSTWTPVRFCWAVTARPSLAG